MNQEQEDEDQVEVMSVSLVAAVVALDEGWKSAARMIALGSAEVQFVQKVVVDAKIAASEVQTVEWEHS